MTGQRPINVLLIDDDEDDFLMLKDLLSEVVEQKFLIEWASSYSQGKEALLKKRHDVCFLDYRLGVHTGLELLKESIAEGVKVPTILLTGYGEHEVDLEAMKFGAADYLVKDQVTPLLLEKTIRHSIHRAQSLQAILDREAQILVQDRLASVGLLASSLAHEIGTPLGVIRGRAEYLEMQVRDNPNVKRNVDVIIAQIDRVSKLIRSLLNLARGDHMKRSEQVLLNQIVSEVLELMAHELRKYDIKIRNELTRDIPIKVRAQADPLHQVILNLLVNALHAIESATKSGRTSGHYIKISAIETVGKWILCVEDTGCGISEKNIKNLFKPFFTTKDIGVGTGLGLATSFRIIETWGGSIEASSREGLGSEFRVLLPKPDPIK